MRALPPFSTKHVPAPLEHLPLSQTHAYLAPKAALAALLCVACCERAESAFGNFVHFVEQLSALHADVVVLRLDMDNLGRLETLRQWARHIRDGQVHALFADLALGTWSADKVLTPIQGCLGLPHGLRHQRFPVTMCFGTLSCLPPVRTCDTTRSQ